jgi:hypothetical protein
LLISSCQPIRRTTPKQLKPAKAVEPVIEYWRPAGGEKAESRDKATQPTKMLGLARISTWQVAAFQDSAEKLIAEHGGVGKFVLEELVHGGESVTDVFVVLEDAFIAKGVQEQIDGALVAGRKLQVNLSSQA